jgi:hypothetical protein
MYMRCRTPCGTGRNTIYQPGANPPTFLTYLPSQLYGRRHEYRRQAQSAEARDVAPSSSGVAANVTETHQSEIRI